MVNGLSTPLRGRKNRLTPPGRQSFPLARICIALIVLLCGGFLLRIALVNDPQGGRPVAETEITSTRDANSIANAVATGPAPGPVIITADPQQYPANEAGITTLPVPETRQANANSPLIGSGILPELAEETSNGVIPRVASTGLTPFVAYRRPTEALPGSATSIAIVVSGLGINEQGSLAAIEQLPPDVSLGFAPYGRSLVNTVNAARIDGHEVLLEVPLEPFDYPQNDPGPHTMLTGDTPRANLDKLHWLMARFGGYFGVINNMGARFTASAADMSPIMEEFGLRGIAYLDDGSSNRSVSAQLAGANRVPYARASAMIDANPSRAAILSALASLEAQAMETGSAIGMISALPISVQIVSEWARELDAKGIALVPVSALMK